MIRVFQGDTRSLDYSSVVPVAGNLTTRGKRLHIMASKLVSRQHITEVGGFPGQVCGLALIHKLSVIAKRNHTS